MDLSLSKMMTEEYQELLRHCVHCGLCLEACPTYTIFGTEADSPRGRIALMRAVVNGNLSLDEFLTTFAGHMKLCLECRACETACPSGVQYGKLITGARITLEEVQHPNPLERLIRWIGMKQLMPHVGSMKVMARLMRLYEVLGIQTAVRTVNILPQPLRAMEGILPPIPGRYIDYSRPAPALGQKQGKVAFFYGCIQEAFLGGVNAATVHVLQRNGYEVHFPQAQTCCGAAQWHTGDEDLAKTLARQNIDAFADYDIIINNAGGCGATLKEYPDLLKDDAAYAEKAVSFAAKVRDFSEFLAANLHELPQGRLRVRAAYSDSCHLRHGQKVVDPPRELLRMIPGLELAELRDPNSCCGSAGIYNITQPTVANAVLDAKMDDVADSRAEVLITSNTGCHMQLLAGVRRRAELDVKVLHIAEMLELSYLAADYRGQIKVPKSPLDKPVRHFGGPALPGQRWQMEWQEKRFKRKGNTPMITLKVSLQPGQVVDDPAELLTYQTDAGVDRGLPSGVVFPYTTGDVQTVMHWSVRRNIPLIARGAGTGLAGGAVATRDKEILVLFSQMKRIVERDADDRSAVVQPGVINLYLNEVAREAGLYFPPDPVSGRASTVGGNIATNAGGPHCFKYGVTTNYITGMEVVLADGDCVRFGGQALDYPELDFVGLFTGSEGTLGIVTEANVRLVPYPPAVKTLLAAFDSVEHAGAAVSAIIARGLIPATLEMMDQRAMNLVEGYSHPGLPTHAGAALIIDVDGYPCSVEPQIEEIAAILRNHKALELRVAHSEAERAKIWKARNSVSGALAHVALDHYTVDGSVPRSRLAETLREVIQIGETWNLPLILLLHAGDGNLHPMVLIADPEDIEFMRRLRAGGREMAELFVSKNGTITGEHGVGMEKRDFMSLMYTADELDVMREIKTLFDPNELLNPDKVLPAGAPAPKSEPTGVAPAPEGIGKPETDAEAAAMITSWMAAGRSIRVRGGGTKQWTVAKSEAVLSTEKLRGIRHYAPEDLYVTVGAGATLDEVQARVNQDGLWLPLISPWPGATVGGIVSANFNAPLRMRYGGARDLVQALTVVLPDGRIIHAGRPVMKNVAGYDLPKLFVGAHGTLGLITDVTFKLSPRPRIRRTIAIPVKNLIQGVLWGKHLAQRSLVASSILLCRGYTLPDINSEHTLLYTAEGLESDVRTEIAGVQDALHETLPPPMIEVQQSGSDVWAAWLQQPVAEGYLLRLGRAPGEISETIGTVLLASAEKCAILADFGSGHVYTRGDVDVETVLKVTRDHRGHTVLLQAAPEAVLPPTVWGHTPEARAKMQELKALWDPQKLFNIGAFVI